MSFACYDPDADIAWFPTGDSDDVISERVPGGLRDYDRATHQRVAMRWGRRWQPCPDIVPTIRPATHLR